MDDFLILINENIDPSEIEYIVEVGCLNAADSMFFKEKFPAANVYAIEGLPDNYEKYLKKNTLINTYNTVICDYVGEIEYFVKSINGIHGIYDRGKRYGTKKITSPCTTLDKFCEENNIPRIDILKIDVEGATLNVLRGMVNILPKVKIMHLETEKGELFEGQALHDEIEKYLTERTFKMISLSQYEPEPNKPQCDSVWIK